MSGDADGAGAGNADGSGTGSGDGDGDGTERGPRHGSRACPIGTLAGDSDRGRRYRCSINPNAMASTHS
jgi:hypothetical protein